jgi:hypothetical protein
MYSPNVRYSTISTSAMDMGRFPELVWATREAVVLLTAREMAERWIHALAGSETVESAQEDAEVQFRSEELAANWRESLRECAFLMGPSSTYLLPHWRAGVEYTKQMSLGYGEAAVRHIHKPPEFESFLQECVAILSERTYRQKLQPYDGLTGEAVGRAVGEFHEFVRTAVTDELGKLALGAWQRHAERRRGAATGTTGPQVESVASKAEPVVTAQQPGATEVEPPMVQVDVTPAQAGSDPTRAAANGNGTAESREARLQEFIRQQNTSVAGVGRTARVAKPDMQRWRRGEMKSESVMARRIEDVLSGKTPLLRSREA